MLAGNPLGYSNALFLSLVREHRAAYHITNRPHIGQVGFAFAVDHNCATLVKCQTHRFRRQSGRVGNPSDGNDQFVDVQSNSFTLGARVGDRHTLFTHLNLAHFHAQLNLQALLGEGLERFLSDLLVNCAKKDWQTFQNGDFSTQATPD